MTRRSARLDIEVYTESQHYQKYDNESRSIDLGEVPVFGKKWAIFHLSNDTNIPLRVASLTFTTAKGQVWETPGVVNAKRVSDPATPFKGKHQQAPFEVQAYGEVLLGVPYAPVEEGDHTAVLAIASNASNGKVIEVSVSAVAVYTGAPDIAVRYGTYEGPDPQDCGADGCVIPESRGLNFGNIGLGAQGVAHLIIKNTATCDAYVGVDSCRVCELLLDRDASRQNIGIGFKAGTNDQNLFAFESSITTPTTLPQYNVECQEEGGEMADGQITLPLDFFAPQQDGIFKTVVVIESSDRDEPLIEIPVVAHARNAPVAVAKFRQRDPQNPSAPYTDENKIEPLKKVYFDGRGSFDPRDPANKTLITSYQWEILEYPPGCNPDDFDLQGATTSLFSFWLPLAGRYKVKLTVWNNDGIQSGETPESFVEFRAKPGSRLHVQLVWDDRSNDQDLHLLYLPQTDQMCNKPWDCHWTNKKPVWVAGNASGVGPNPRLDIDKTTGLGPENINIDEPIPATYRVYVHYYADSYDASPTHNTVRIFLNGLQVAEYRRTLSEETKWAVADITWRDDGTGFVTPYPGDVANQVGTVTPASRLSCQR